MDKVNEIKQKIIKKLIKSFNIVKNIMAIFGTICLIALLFANNNEDKHIANITQAESSINNSNEIISTNIPIIEESVSEIKLDETNVIELQGEQLENLSPIENIDTDSVVTDYYNLVIPTLDTIPEYNNNAYVYINNNQATFSSDLISDTSWEVYYGLDDLGRCTMCIASIGTDIMPTTDRANISSIKPSGWQEGSNNLLNGTYIYNRCHLIGYQLTAENANEYNLITGTRYLNIDGMLSFENQVADYIKQTNNHVLYQAIPIFKENELVCRGVWIQAFSEEDNGQGINFNVYCFNVYPNINIDYATGAWALIQTQQDNSECLEVTAKPQAIAHIYVLNINSKKIHTQYCSYGNRISEKNKKIFEGQIEDLLKQGYTACEHCNP